MEREGRGGEEEGRRMRGEDERDKKEVRGGKTRMEKGRRRKRERGNEKDRRREKSGRKGMGEGWKEERGGRYRKPTDLGQDLMLGQCCQEGLGRLRKEQWRTKNC